MLSWWCGGGVLYVGENKWGSVCLLVCELLVDVIILIFNVGCENGCIGLTS